MTCIQCSKGKMRPGLANIDATVKGETLPVSCTAMVCGRCGFHVLAPEQVDAYTVASADEYRRRHGLLTTREIQGFRRSLGMTQQEFADYLPVGVASVKRWELGQIQDRALDELMRVKCDRAHCLSVLQKLRPAVVEMKPLHFAVPPEAQNEGGRLRRYSAVMLKVSGAGAGPLAASLSSPSKRLVR